MQVTVDEPHKYMYMWSSYEDKNKLNSLKMMRGTGFVTKSQLRAY